MLARSKRYIKRAILGPNHHFSRTSIDGEAMSNSKPSLKRSFSGLVRVNVFQLESERHVSRRIGSHPGLKMMCVGRIRHLLSIPGLSDYFLEFLDPKWLLGAVTASNAISPSLPEEWLRLSFRQHREYTLTKMLTQRPFFIDDFFGFLHAVVLGSCTLRRATEIYSVFHTHRPLMSLFERFTSILACDCSERDIHNDIIHTCRHVRVFDGWEPRANSRISALETVIEDHVLWGQPHVLRIWTRDHHGSRILVLCDCSDMVSMSDLSTEDEDDDL